MKRRIVVCIVVVGLVVMSVEMAIIAGCASARSDRHAEPSSGQPAPGGSGAKPTTEARQKTAGVADSDEERLRQEVADKIHEIEQRESHRTVHTDRDDSGLIPWHENLVYPASPSADAWAAVRANNPNLRGFMLPRGPGIPVLPGSLPSASEELWIIQKPDKVAQPADENRPGSGALMAVMPGEEKQIPLPLKHTDVSASISAYIATVDVTQQYHNPYDSKIEAVYVFPLPENAAVNEFIMTVGERRIRGIIKEREEAERTYAEAKAQGYVASLLTQERPNVFTQKVANIEPGKAIDINIKYFHTLAYVDGWYEYVFPMVVGPRFNPPGSTDGVGAVARGMNGKSGQKSEVQYLKPGERSGHDISLAVKIDAGVAIEEVKSTNHVVAVKKGSPEQVAVKLSELDAIPNKDFVLRYKVAGQRIKSALLTHKDERGGFFSLLVYPPEDLKTLTRKPLEMVFVLDCSGSMNGQPIAQAKKAVERALRNMQPDDTFQIVRFSIGASQLGSAPVAATRENVRRGLTYLESLQGEGGTMMVEGIKVALDFPHDESRLRFVAFLTDGYIGNEAEILREIHGRLGASRIFSFGVGQSTNRFLLDSMAKMGSGAVAYVSLNENAGEIMDLFFERISHPAMTNIAVNWGGMQVSDVFPSSMPDLFVGRPVIVTGRFSGEVPAGVAIRGEAGGQVVDVAVPVDLADASSTHAGLPAVWARTKIADLADRSLYTDGTELPGAIKQVALEYGLMSAYTAFVAVDSLTRTVGDHGTTVNVAVPVPEGVRYETTVQER